jgi:diguanylate cyclase (GGDEF)-like protein
MCVARQRVWLATSSGLLSLDAQGQARRAAIPGLPETDLAVIVCGRGGQLWLAHEDGRLWQVTSGPDGVQTAQRVAPEPLGRRLIVSMLEDRRGWLWLGTDNGLLVHTPAGWRRFDDSNGLVWDDANGYALHEDAAGHLWVGTSRGVSQIVDPAQMLEPLPLPFEIDTVRHGSRRWRPDEPVVLAWSHEPVRVDWHRRGFTNRSSDLVQYRLGNEPDGDWNPGEPTGLRFDALPPGEHHLEVYASNPALGARSATLALTITVTPPWWRTPWMYAACGVTVAALGWLAYRWRLRELMRRQRQLEAQVLLRTQDLAASHEAMRELALTDSLTGVPNRRAIMDAAGREFARVQRGEGSLTVAVVDIDHFKRINDTCGHPAGDEVLRQVVARLAATLRANDQIGRYGGEEFLVLLPSGPSPDGGDVGQGLQRLCSVIADQPFELGDLGPLKLTCSIGAASAQAPTLPGHSLANLIQAADRALYRVKANGRNGVEWARAEP